MQGPDLGPSDGVGLPDLEPRSRASSFSARLAQAVSRHWPRKRASSVTSTPATGSIVDLSLDPPNTTNETRSRSNSGAVAPRSPATTRPRVSSGVFSRSRANSSARRRGAAQAPPEPPQLEFTLAYYVDRLSVTVQSLRGTTPLEGSRLYVWRKERE